jgi:hypothetical protein
VFFLVYQIIKLWPLVPQIAQAIPVEEHIEINVHAEEEIMGLGNIVALHIRHILVLHVKQEGGNALTGHIIQVVEKKVV